MEPFVTIKSIPAPLPMINIDTDMIIPKQFLKTIKRSGLGKNLFHELRYDIQGNIKKPAIKPDMIEIYALFSLIALL